MTDKENLCNLLFISVRGEIAKAFINRDMNPTPEEWMLLNGNKELTLRDLGELAYKLDYNPVWSFDPIPEEQLG